MKKITLIFTSCLFMTQNRANSITSKQTRNQSPGKKEEIKFAPSETYSTIPSRLFSGSTSNTSRTEKSTVVTQNSSNTTPTHSITYNEPINSKSKKNLAKLSEGSAAPSNKIATLGKDLFNTSISSKTNSSIGFNEASLAPTSISRSSQSKAATTSKNSTIDDFLNNLPIHSMVSLSKTFSEHDLIKNHELIRAEWLSQKDNFTTITTHITNITADIDKRIKESKDSNEKIALESFKNLLSQLNDILNKANTSINLDFASFDVCLTIFMLSEKLKLTKNDFEEDLIKSKIKELWDQFYLSQQKADPLTKKNIEQINSAPLNFNEDVLLIIDHANKTIKKFDSLSKFQNLCKELPEFFESLKNLDLNNDVTSKIIKFESLISEIKIDNTLPHLTNSVISILPILNDLLTLTILGSAIQIEVNNNAQHSGFTGFFKKKFTPITLIGSGSLRNILMFSPFKVHSSNSVNNYSNSAHNWYSSNYRIPNIINKTSTEKRNNLAQILKLQKVLILKMIEVFTHNYQSKNLLTRKDCNHIEKLLYQLQLISNILIKTDASLENIQYTQAQIDHMKFYLHSVAEDLAYLKRRPTYRPTSTFFESKKNKEIESLEILLKEKSVIGLQRLSKILSNYFQETKLMTIKNEEDPNDPVDNNLFQIKVDHDIVKKIKD